MLAMDEMMHCTRRRMWPAPKDHTFPTAVFLQVCAGTFSICESLLVKENIIEGLLLFMCFTLNPMTENKEVLSGTLALPNKSINSFISRELLTHSNYMRTCIVMSLWCSHDSQNAERSMTIINDPGKERHVHPQAKSFLKTVRKAENNPYMTIYYFFGSCLNWLKVKWREETTLRSEAALCFSLFTVGCCQIKPKLSF